MNLVKIKIHILNKNLIKIILINKKIKHIINPLNEIYEFQF